MNIKPTWLLGLTVVAILAGIVIGARIYTAAAGG